MLIAAMILIIQTAFLGSTRAMHSMSVEGNLPKILGRTNSRGTPWVAMLVGAAFNLAFISMNSAAAILGASAIGYTVAHGISLFAYVKANGPAYAGLERPFKAPKNWKIMGLIFGLFNVPLCVIGVVYVNSLEIGWTPTWVAFIVLALYLPIWLYTQHELRRHKKNGVTPGASADLAEDDAAIWSPIPANGTSLQQVQSVAGRQASCSCRPRPDHPCSEPLFRTPLRTNPSFPKEIPVLAPFLNIPVSLFLAAGTIFCLTKAMRGRTWLPRWNYGIHALMALGMLGMVWHGVDLPLLPQLLLFGVASFWFLLQAVSRAEFSLLCHTRSGGSAVSIMPPCLQRWSSCCSFPFSGSPGNVNRCCQSRREWFTCRSCAEFGCRIRARGQRAVDAARRAISRRPFALAVLIWLLPVRRIAAGLRTGRVPRLRRVSRPLPVILERSYEAGAALTMSLMFAAASM